MTITGDYLLLFLGLIALGLSFYTLKYRVLVVSLAAAISWLVLGILMWTNQLGTSISDPWVYALSLVFFLMIIAVLTRQMTVDIRHEAKVRGGGTTSYTTTVSGRRKKPTSSERQSGYREMLRGKTRRG